MTPDTAQPTLYRFYDPHKDGEGCSEPKPPELTDLLNSLDDKQGTLRSVLRAIGEVVPDADVEVHDDYISVRCGPRVSGYRMHNYRAIRFERVLPPTPPPPPDEALRAAIDRAWHLANLDGWNIPSIPKLVAAVAPLLARMEGEYQELTTAAESRANELARELRAARSATEAVRRELAESQVGRTEALVTVRLLETDFARAKEARDAALKRAEAAEADRDSARQCVDDAAFVAKKIRDVMVSAAVARAEAAEAACGAMRQHWPKDAVPIPQVAESVGQSLLDERDRLTADNARLRAALEPFAKAGSYVMANWPGKSEMHFDHGEPACPTVGDYRRAAEALRPATENQPTHGGTTDVSADP